MTKWLHKLDSDHNTSALRKRLVLSVASTMIQYFTGRDHSIQFENCFQVIMEIKHSVSETIPACLISTVAAIAIKNSRPKFCKRKKCLWVLSLLRSWFLNFLFFYSVCAIWYLLMVGYDADSYIMTSLLKFFVLIQMFHELLLNTIFFEFIVYQ